MYIRISVIIVLLLKNYFLSFASNEPKPELKYYVFEQDGKKGLKNLKDEIIIPAKYDDLGWSDQDFYPIDNVTGYKLRKKWGLIDVGNKIITDTLFTSLYSKGKAGLIIATNLDNITQKNYYGLIKANGKILIDFNYTKLSLLNDRVIAYFESGKNISKVGLLDLEGREILPFIYSSIKPMGSLRFLAEDFQGNLFIFSENGVPIGEFAYDSISGFENDFAKLYSFHNVGLISRNGNIVIEPGYSEIEIIDKSTASVRRYPKWVSMDINRKILGTFHFDEIKPVNDSIFQVRAGNKEFLISNSNEIITEGGFDSIANFYDGQAIVRNDNKFGILNIDGNLIQRPFYDNLQSVNDLYISKLGNEVNLLNQFGKNKNSIPFKDMTLFKGDIFKVKRGDYWGLMDSSGDMIINPVYDSIYAQNFDRIIVRFKKTFYGIIDIDENWIILPQENPLDFINDELFVMYNGIQKRIFNYKNELIYFTENELDFKETYFLEHQQDGKIWKINYSGVIMSGLVEGVISKNEYKYSEVEEIHEPSEGFIGIKKDGKYGFIDFENRLRIANRYDSIGRFKEGYAPFMILGKWGFLDQNETIVIQPTFDEVGEFNNGITTARRGDRYYIINKAGVSIFKDGFEFMDKLNTGNYLVKFNDRFGLLDENGNSLITTKFDELHDLGNGYAIIKNVGKFGVIDLKGVDIIPRAYDEIKYFNDLEIYMLKDNSDWEKINTKFD